MLIMSSHYEGFPCVVGEALACGLPVVSFDCDSGPRDIIRHGVDGLLVTPNIVEALAAAMDRLMCDAGERLAMGGRAPEVMKRFSLAVILQRWERLFAKAIALASHAVKSIWSRYSLRRWGAEGPSEC